MNISVTKGKKLTWKIILNLSCTENFRIFFSNCFMYDYTPYPFFLIMYGRLFNFRRGSLGLDFFSFCVFLFLFFKFFSCIFFLQRRIIKSDFFLTFWKWKANKSNNQIKIHELIKNKNLSKCPIRIRFYFKSNYLFLTTFRIRCSLMLQTKYF